MNPARILFVDDEPHIQLVVGDQLRLEGHEVVAATSGEEALQALKLTPPDLIILDISMPGMTGLALLKKLSGPDGKPRYPILVFSARANMEQFFTSTGVEGFLAKTSDPGQLVAEVRRILLKTRGSAQPQPAQPQPAAPGTAKPRKALLILEDEPLLGTRLRTAFNIAGYHTLVVPESRQLSEALQTRHPAVILLKAILPGTTGIAVAATLADYTTAKRIPVVLYDGSGLHKAGETFPHVSKFVASNTPADLLKVVSSLAS